MASEEWPTHTRSMKSQAAEQRLQAGNTFMIRSRKEPKRTIALIKGEVQVVEDIPVAAGSWQWECVKWNGWYGLCNPVSGTYIGHYVSSMGFRCSSTYSVVAKASSQGASECFMTGMHQDGGYMLLMRHKDQLLKMSISEDGKGLCLKDEDEGTAWEFVNADLVAAANHLYPE